MVLTGISIVDPTTRSGRNNVIISSLVDDGNNRANRSSYHRVIEMDNNVPLLGTFFYSVNENIAIPFDFNASDLVKHQVNYSIVEDTQRMQESKIEDPTLARISFNQPIPDYENPHDLNEDRIFSFNIRASDGIDYITQWLKLRLMLMKHII